MLLKTNKDFSRNEKETFSTSCSKHSEIFIHLLARSLTYPSVHPSIHSVTGCGWNQAIDLQLYIQFFVCSIFGSFEMNFERKKQYVNIKMSKVREENKKNCESYITKINDKRFFFSGRRATEYGTNIEKKNTGDYNSFR